MNKKDILNHLKEQAQKAKQSVAQTVKEMADESGLSSKEGREDILKKAKGLANKTKQSIQDTAQRGASAAKKAVDKSIEKAQTASNQIKESIACNGYISGCAEKIRQFECQEKMTYSKAESRVNYSCPLYYK